MLLFVVVVVIMYSVHSPVLSPRAGGVVSVLGAAAEDKLGEVTSLRLRRSVLGAWNLNTHHEFIRNKIIRMTLKT